MITYFIRDGFQISMFEAKATDLYGQGHGFSFEAKIRIKPVIKNKLKFKFRSAYFQCYNNYILLYVTIVNSLTPTPHLLSQVAVTFQKH